MAMKPWGQVDARDKELIRSVLMNSRSGARQAAVAVIHGEHVKSCTVHTLEQHTLMALKIGERAEETIDAALERLGFAL